MHSSHAPTKGLPGAITEKSSDMLVEVVTDTDDFKNLRKQWSDLLSSYDTVPLPLTHEWLFNWWKVFGENVDLHIVAVYKHEELVAIAPFIIEKYHFCGMPVMRQKLMANDHSPYCNIIFNKKSSIKDKYEATSAIINESTADLLSVFKVPQDSLVVDFIETFTPRERISGISPEISTPIISTTGDWDTFYKSKSRKFRKSLQNKLNRFSRESDFTIKHEQIVSRQSRYLEDIVAISRSSWKSKIGRDLGSNRAGREFLFRLADELGDLGKVSIWIMYKSSVPIAYEYHVEYGDVVYPINADFSEAYRAYSPGSILEYTALKSLFMEERIKEYYSCANDYWYLNNWSKQLQRQLTINLYATTLKGRILHLWEYTVKPLLRPAYRKYTEYFRRNQKKTRMS